MRLVDADNIISVCEILSEKGNDPHYWGQLISIIKDVPTIDAIPVGWLREKMQKPQMTCANPFGYVLAEWLEEQEAR